MIQTPNLSCLYRSFLLSILLAAGPLLLAQTPMTKTHENGRGNGVNSKNETLAISRLVTTENLEATDENNVEQRYRELSKCMGGIVRSGGDPSVILTRQQAEELNEAIRQGDKTQAVTLVRDAIARLEQVYPSDSHDLRGAPDIPRHPVPPMHKPAMALTPQTSCIEKWSVYNRFCNNAFANVLKLCNPVIDEEAGRLYICGTKSTYLAIIDLATNKVVETVDLGAPGGFIIPDFPNDKLYIFDFHDVFMEFDLKTQATSFIQKPPEHVKIPVKGVPREYNDLFYTGTGYPYQVNYLQDANASYGVIHIKDEGGKEVSRILHGPDANFFEIHPGLGRLYSSNTGDGSLTVYDIRDNRNTVLAEIQLGVSVDQLELVPEKNLLAVSNRLGGNMVSLFNTKTRALEFVPNENENKEYGIGLWPTGIAWFRGAIFVLSHYAGRIDVVLPSSKRVVRRIDLQLPSKPRTDSISCMVKDERHGILYVAVPELGIISIIDANQLKLLKNVNVSFMDVEAVNKNSGPSKIILAADKHTGNLFVYLPGEKRLLKLAGKTGDVTMETALEVDVIDRNMMFCDGKNQTLYVGNLIVDTADLSVKGSFDRDGWVVGVDSLHPENHRYLLVSKKSGAMKDPMIMEYDSNNRATRFWTLTSVLSITPSVVFDFQNKVFYTGGYESSFVEKYSLSSGQDVNANARNEIVPNVR